MPVDHSVLSISHCLIWVNHYAMPADHFGTAITYQLVGAGMGAGAWVRRQGRIILVLCDSWLFETV